MLHLILGPDHKMNTNAILHQLLEKTKEGKDGQYLIVPEQFSFETERMLCRIGGDTVSRFAEVLSLSRLAGRVESVVGGTADLWLDHGGRLLMAAQAVEHVHSRIKLYAAVCKKPEFLEMFLSFVDELENYGIIPQRLAELSQGFTGRFAEKLQELALLYESYLAVCSQAKDPALRLQNLNDNLEYSDFACGKDFYFCHFFDFTMLEQQIMESLLRKANSVTIAFSWEDARGMQVFSAAQDAVSSLERFCKRNQIPVQKTETSFDATVPGDLLHLQKNLSCTRDAVYTGEKNNVSFCVYESPEEECRHAAIRICNLIKNGARYRDIAVICGDLTTYAPTAKQIFSLANIPCFVADKTDLTLMGGAKMLLNALRAVSADLERETVVDYLKSGAPALTADQCDRLENYAVLWNISGKKWASEWMWHPAGLGMDWKDEHYKQLEELNGWRVLAVSSLVELRDKLRCAENVRQMVSAVYAFTEEIHLDVRMQEYADKLYDLGEFQRSQQFAQIYDILVDALEQMGMILGDFCRSVDDFCILFEKLLAQYQISTVPATVDEVQLGEASALRGRQFQHVLVLGAGEGNFPAFSGGEGVFTEEERHQLICAGLSMAPLRADAVDREICGIYSALRSARKTLHMSCSGEPSYILKRCADLFGGFDAAEEGDAILNSEEYAGAVLRGELACEDASVLACADDMKAARDYAFGELKKETVDRLYGKELFLSASKIDKIAACRFAYFLRYGLRAEERKEVRFDASAFGTFVHDVLEKTVRKVMQTRNFRDISREELETIASQMMDDYISEHLADLSAKDAKFEYLMQRNKQEAIAVVRDLGDELRCSRFEPAAEELKFGGGGEMPAITFEGKDSKASLMGFVDRVDLYKHGDTSYVRVVDYKTGTKDFDYADISVGEGMQMLIYLFAMKRFGRLAFGNDLQPAGVLYHMARQNLLSETQKITAEEAAMLHLKKKNRKGLIRDDDVIISAMEEFEKEPIYLPFSIKKDGRSGDLCSCEEIRLLEEHVFSMLGKLADDIVSGDVTPNPILRDAMNSACTYCEFHDVCQKDRGNQQPRPLKKISNRKFFEDLKRGADTDG